jgi:putative transposase
MLNLIIMMLSSLYRGFRTQAAIQAEIIALRHQLVVLQRRQKTKRLILHQADRCLWVWLSQLWSGWRSALIIVKPETVIARHRQGFRWYWTWKIRHGRTGRPSVSKEIRDLIRTISRMNVLWGAPRIHSELLKLGVKISCATQWPNTWPGIESRLHKRGERSSTISVSPCFRLLHGAHDLVRGLVRLLSSSRMTADASSISTSPLIRPQNGLLSKSSKPFFSTAAPKYLLRDRDRIYGYDFRKQVEVMGIKESPQCSEIAVARAYVERVIGSIRRDCLDHVVIFNEDGLRRTLRAYFRYYHRSRLHLSLGKDSPVSQLVEPIGKIVAIPEVGGLHHRYARRAA